MDGFGGDGHDGNPFALISKMGTALTKPLLRMGEIFTIPEHDTENNDVANDNAVDNQFTRMSIEGTLYQRKGRSYKWKRRIVVLKFENGGSFECYGVNKESPSQMLKEMYSQLHRQSSVGSALRNTTDPRQLMLLLRTDMPWIVRDIQNDPSCFVVEIPTFDPKVIQDLTHDSEPFMPQGSFDSSDNSREVRTNFEQYPFYEDEESFDSFEEGTMTLSTRAKLEKDFKSARSHKRPLRLYFKCPRQGNEKTLWLRGFAKLGRLSPDPWNKYRFFGKLTQLGAATSRLRQDTSSDFNRAARSLEMEQFSPQFNLSKHQQKDDNEKDRREFRAFPTYCYPHLWMTRSEMREECNLPSTKFHDLRIDEKKGQEIGTLRIEVLQGLGLPKLDKNSESDGVCYLVCGSYAFATDVIPNNNNPIWMRKSRRACIFPIFHGYARLFIGVFDHDGFTNKDDFAGRVVIDLAQLRSGSCYDVTLPLRLSAHVYSRRQQGAIRLRFQLDYGNQRDALLSYLPSRIRIPEETFPDTSTTVMCTDATSFRNIVLTVHGVHPPGKFSFNQFRATLKEFNFSRRKTMQLIRRTIRETRTWLNPAISCYVFCAWMHCVYIASFGLVPAYYVTFLLLHLFRNYAHYTLDGPASKGFLPPTWEEMWCALARTKSVPIEPVSIRPLHKIENKPDSSPDKLSFPDSFVVENHRPKGKFLFRLLGFLRSDEALMENPDQRHLEFPFASGDVYPKVQLEKALNTKQKAKERGSSSDQNYDDISLPSNADDDELINGTESPVVTPRHLNSKVGNSSSLPSPQRLYFEESPSTNGDNKCEDDCVGESRSENNDLSIRTEELLVTPKNGINPRDLIPDQDIDFVIDNGGKKLTDDLVEIRENMHRLTWNLFNDRTHVIKDDDVTFFGADKKSTKKKNVDQQLQRLLDVGGYSHSNPFVARAGLYMMPLVGAALSFLSVARSSFNVWTWRDPFLSFWFSIFGILLAFILFIFPWRLFSFVAGIILVGPQNWVMRILRERRGIPSSTVINNENDEKSENVTNGQPLFKSHPQPNHRYTEINAATINPKKVHHVVVPYSPLKYQNRFYDWPPEPEHCTVKIRPPLKRRPTSISEGIDSSSGNTGSPQDFAASTEFSDSISVVSRISGIQGMEGVPPMINTAGEVPRRRRTDTEDSQYRNSFGSGRQRCNSDSSPRPPKSHSRISKDKGD
mmetsp:Transcript_18701/g.27673  ORF Transcript_18701/g.27673 Transcript_18701/m.27673 type:complete len:1202 (-) Transcript_18701:122-3727(-)|eukprot:CAMPEP_0194228354 /NCGR_PEP_ID=MMETSP0156-20130528/43330_1 /TAXON_ID=33649 /ORGANISM="Thalassionema nitzschioides, Strain L26-B" /LENGTH=1201 /DNA_ID=CAMNT_0038960865 /DNA_START=81 /DNA_END=3689 /DNA_ORIENTATION=-